MASGTRNKLAGADKKRTIEQTLTEEAAERNSNHSKFSRFHHHLENKESQSLTTAESQLSENTPQTEGHVTSATATNPTPEDDLPSTAGQTFQSKINADFPPSVCNAHSNPSPLCMNITGIEIVESQQIPTELQTKTTDACETTKPPIQQTRSLESTGNGIQPDEQEETTKKTGLMHDTYNNQAAANLLPDQLQLSLHDVLSISKDCFIKGLVRVRVAHVKKTADKFAATVVDEKDDNTHVYLTGDLQSALIGIKPGQLYGLRFSEWKHSEKRLAIISSTQVKQP